MRGRGQFVLIVAFFVLLAVVNSYPLILSPGSSIGQHGDSFFSVWRLAWIAHQLHADPRHLFDGNIFYPERDTLAYSDAMLLPSIALAPFNWAGVSPLAIYNLVLIGAFALSGIAAYLLVRTLTGSTPAGLVAGIIFAFSPHRLEHFDHLELQFAFWIPLAVLAWHRAVGDNHTSRYLSVAALTTGQVLSCIYHGIFLLTWLSVLTGIWFARVPVRGLRAGTIMLLPPLLALAVYSLPYLRARSEFGDRPTTEVAGYSAVPADFLSAPGTSRLYGWTEHLGASERHLFPGIMATLLVIVGLWPPFDRIRLVHAAGLALAIELTFGFNGGLYNLLYDWVVPYRGLRVPARADILVLLGTAVLAGFGLARVVSRIARPRWASATATVVVVVAALECLGAPRLVPVESKTSVWYSWLRTMPDAVVFEWPVTVPWRLYTMEDVAYMYRSTLHWRPLLNGYSGHYPRSYIDLLYHVRSFPDTASLADLQRRGATVLIVHEVAGSRPSFDSALERLVRDRDVRLIAKDQESGKRVVFLTLLQPTPAIDLKR